MKGEKKRKEKTEKDRNTKAQNKEYNFVKSQSL